MYGWSCAVARLAYTSATKSRASTTCPVHVAAVAPHSGTETIPILVATCAVRAIDIIAHAGALVASAWRTVRSKIWVLVSMKLFKVMTSWRYR